MLRLGALGSSCGGSVSLYPAVWRPWLHHKEEHEKCILCELRRLSLEERQVMKAFPLPAHRGIGRLCQMSYRGGHALLEVMSGGGGSLKPPQTQTGTSTLALRGLCSTRPVVCFELIKESLWWVRVSLLRHDFEDFLTVVTILEGADCLLWSYWKSQMVLCFSVASWFGEMLREIPSCPPCYYSGITLKTTSFSAEWFLNWVLTFEYFHICILEP